MNNNELMHYGVLGMKWGVKRGKSAKVYAKASKKLSKMERKVNKTQDEVNKHMYKADKIASRTFFRDSSAERKYRKRAAEAQKKANGYKYKAVDWIKKMDKQLKNTPNKLSKSQKALGEKYVESLRRSREMNMIRTFF